jgi:DNA-directed RNA polymerase sigma subunit (sigma70/sigma32)
METKLKNELGLEFTVQNYPISYISLQKEIGPNDGNKHQCLEDVIIDHNAKNPGIVFEEQDTLEYIERVIKTLKDDEQYIIRNRYGFDGDKKTLDEIATTLNLSRERIFAKEKEILHKLSYRVKINS